MTFLTILPSKEFTALEIKISVEPVAKMTSLSVTKASSLLFHHDTRTI